MESRAGGPSTGHSKYLTVESIGHPDPGRRLQRHPQKYGKKWSLESLSEPQLHTPLGKDYVRWLRPTQLHTKIGRGQRKATVGYLRCIVSKDFHRTGHCPVCELESTWPLNPTEDLKYLSKAWKEKQMA